MQNFLTMFLRPADLIVPFATFALVAMVIVTVFFIIKKRNVFLSREQAFNAGTCCLFVIFTLSCIFTASSMENMLSRIGIITFSFSGAQLGFNSFSNKKAPLLIPVCLMTALLCAFGGGILIRDLFLLHKLTAIDWKDVLIAILMAILSIAFCYTGASRQPRLSFTIIFDFFYTLGLVSFTVGTEALLIDIIPSYPIVGIGGTFLCCVGIGWILTALLYHFERWRVYDNIAFSFNVLKIQATLSLIEPLTDVKQERIIYVACVTLIGSIIQWARIGQGLLFYFTDILPPHLRMIKKETDNPTMVYYKVSTSPPQIPLNAKWLEGERAIRGISIGVHRRSNTARINRRTSRCFLIAP